MRKEKNTSQVIKIVVASIDNVMQISSAPEIRINLYIYDTNSITRLWCSSKRLGVIVC